MATVQCDFCFEKIDNRRIINEAYFQDDVSLLSSLSFCSKECRKRYAKEVEEILNGDKR